MKYTPIIGSLGYILSPDQEKVLLVHRIARHGDDHHGKYNGLGGKMDCNEDIATCMKREIYEEAGIQATQMSLRGTINWTGFGPREENWFGFIFLITRFEGTPNDKSPEGPLMWIPKNKLFDLPMWEGDRYFLPLVFDDDERTFHAYMPYNKNKPLSFNYIR